MSLMNRVANLFRRSTVGREIDEELAAHIEMRTEDNIRAGMSAEEAKRDALLRFGNRVAMKEHVTAADTELWIASLGRDLRYAFRRLRRSPGFALTVIVTLALGIGANVVVLGVVNALILHPLSLPNVDRMYNVVQKGHGNDNQSYPDYLDYRARNTTFADMAVYRLNNAGLSIGGHAEPRWLYEVSGNYFDMLDVRPELGRVFHASDEHGANSAPYIVLSDGFWRSRFAADPKVIGRAVRIDGHPFTIIGVAPPEFHGIEAIFWPDFWMPIVDEQLVDGYDLLTRRYDHGSWIVGLLKPGVTPAQATENLNAIAGELAKQYPATDQGMGARLVRAGLMADSLRDPARDFLYAIAALALLVLAAACVNLASLFAARAADRGRELAIRLAIGASRWNVLRQLLMEALLLALGGGVIGTVFAAALLRGLTHWQPITMFPMIRVSVEANANVFMAALGLSLASGILFGLLPARQVWRTDAAEMIKGAVGAKMLFRRFTLRDALLGVQIVLCTLLVTASLVAVRGMQRSLHAPLGFDPDGAMLAMTNMAMAGYTNASSLTVEKRMLDAAGSAPGIAAAGLISDAPLVDAGGSETSIYREGTTEFTPAHVALDSRYYAISPGYRKAAGTRLLAGRDVSWDDTPSTPPVAVINETFARKLFGSAREAIGRRFLDAGKDAYTVIGVVEAGKYNSLTEEPSAAAFYPLGQAPNRNITLVVRSQMPEADTAATLRRAVTGADPGLPYTITSWRRALGLVMFPTYAATATLGVMGVLAAMLAITGVFGMAAYSVSRRMRELGIRVALGAQRGQLMRSALGRPLALLLSGSLAGLVLGVIASRLLAAIVYEATPKDPLVLGGVVATMALIGLIATWMPARRALSVDPARLLRAE